MIFYAFELLAVLLALAWVAHYVSYRHIKLKTLRERRWDYNICCGTTDGGGINADIVRHASVPRFERVQDVTRLPHRDGAFEHVLCSHTIEHVSDPAGMYRELRRIGRQVTLLVPPLWDFTAALNPLEHQVIFLTAKSRHDNQLPPFIRYTPARWLQARLGQKIQVDARCGDKTLVQVLADLAIPVLLLAGAALSLLDHRWGLSFWAAAGIAYLLSTRRFTPAPLRTGTAKLKPSSEEIEAA